MEIYCSNNHLTSLPRLNKKLEELYCINNDITILPPLNEKLEFLTCRNNPVDELFVPTDDLESIKLKMITLNNFRRLYYSLKFKRQFRRWLWELVREPAAIAKYHPCYLAEYLADGGDLDNVLDEWVGED